MGRVTMEYLDSGPSDSDLALSRAAAALWRVGRQTASAGEPPAETGCGILIQSRDWTCFCRQEIRFSICFCNWKGRRIILVLIVKQIIQFRKILLVVNFLYLESATLQHFFVSEIFRERREGTREFKGALHKMWCFHIFRRWVSDHKACARRRRAHEPCILLRYIRQLPSLSQQALSDRTALKRQWWIFWWLPAIPGGFLDGFLNLVNFKVQVQNLVLKVGLTWGK